MQSARTERAARPTATGSLQDRLFATRKLSLDLAKPLSPEDMVVQAMDDTSPTKWHLAHVTWFFETFVLAPYLRGYRPFDDRFNYCFNSYYESQGARHPRPRRGLLTRPSTDEVIAYRSHVDEALAMLFASTDVGDSDAARLIEIGIHHEQQHQELLLTDILALFAASPLHPAYRPQPLTVSTMTAQPPEWIDYPGGIHAIGHDESGFAWDNEGPRHDALVHPFRLADRLVTNGEWLAFMDDSGYGNALLWLADGWTTVANEGWQSPRYWENIDGAWQAMTLHGLRPLDYAAPVSHISYVEADAFARWAGKRLPTEFEWEVATNGVAVGGTDLCHDPLRPMPAAADTNEMSAPRQMFGDVWQWTQSAYLPYPGYRPPQGAIGEYNGKFMVSQHVLRGSSCVTPPGHARRSYRNFFYPHQRWQFAGLRLAEDVS